MSPLLRRLTTFVLILLLVTATAVPTARSEVPHPRHWTADADGVLRVTFSDNLNYGKPWRGRSRYLVAWPLEDAVKAWDASPHVDATYTTERCGDRPRCVPVYRSEERNTGAYGRTVLYVKPDGSISDDSGFVEIYADSKESDGFKRNLLCHELGHVFGIQHHGEAGCVSQERSTPSDYELDILRQFYQEGKPVV